MHRVEWTVQALTDLDRLEDFLFYKNALAAGRAIQTIVAATDRLAFFPERGRPLPTGHRELVVRFSDGGYLVLYDVEGDGVRILRLRHQREGGY